MSERVTDKQTLLDLADRVEAASGPSVDLDRQAIVAMGGALKPGDCWWFGHKFVGRYVPFYTASLDSAMSLVPEGCWAEGALGSHNSTRASIEVHGPFTYDPLGRAWAATPALALTAAALRAKAATLDEETDRG